MFTKGPWYAKKRNARDPWKVLKTETEVIATIWGTTVKQESNSAEQQQANARLIAAAPDLLEACQLMQVRLRIDGRICAMLDAAIAKATEAV